MTEDTGLRPFRDSNHGGTPGGESFLHPLSLAGSFGVFLYLGWMLLARAFHLQTGWFAGAGWHWTPLVYYCCLDAFALALSAAFLCGFDGRSFRLLGLAIFPGCFRHAMVGLGCGVCVISLATLLLQLTHADDVVLFAARSGGSVLFLVCFLVLAAAFEEMAFRGYALARAADSVGPVVACLVSSALFGFAHSANPQATLLSTANTALAGVLLSIARLRSGALWMPIALHFAWNFSLGAVFSFPVSGLALGATRFSSPGPGPMWLTGGAYGPEASVLLTAALAVAIPLLLRYPRQVSPGATPLPTALKES